MLNCEYSHCLQADTLLGDIDLFECTSVVKASGKKGYGFDIEVSTL